MKSKYLFWVLLGLLIAVLSLVYFLKVKESAKKLSEHVDHLSQRTVAANNSVVTAVGKGQVAEMLEMQTKVREDVLGRLQASFIDRDNENLDLWFTDLKTPWKTFPPVDDFQRYYDLARDRLARETDNYLSDHGIKGKASQLISYSSLTDMPDSSKEEREDVKVEMRRRQKEFWIQDRLVRLFARVGGWMARPIKGGASSGISANGVSSAAFERTRYDVRVRVKGDRLIDLLHALDAPVTLTSEDGGPLVVALSVVIDNIAIKSLDLDLSLVQNFEDSEPPVEVSFLLTVLDYHARARR